MSAIILFDWNESASDVISILALLDMASMSMSHIGRQTRQRLSPFLTRFRRKRREADRTSAVQKLAAFKRKSASRFSTARLKRHSAPGIIRFRRQRAAPNRVTCH